VGIGIRKTNADIGIPASVISVWYRSKKMLDCIDFIPVPDRFRHR
jgi:hypothetical protein